MYTFLLSDLVMRSHCVACVLSVVGMALPKAVGYMVVLLVICYSLENQGHTQSLNVFFEVRRRINRL